MAVKFLDNTGLGYFWSKIKTWCNSTFAAIAHTHTSYAVKHSYTTAANAAKNWYRIANANTSQTDTTKPIHAQFILTAYNASYDAGYYERWFVNAEVFGRTPSIVIFGNSQAPFSQARILYENTIADLDANDRPAIDIYLNNVLANGTTKIEIEEVYNQGWTFVADGQISASTVPTGFEGTACDALRSNGVGRSTYADYANVIGLQRSDITSNITLADNNTYRSRVFNCTGTRTVTVPSINSVYSWFVIKNFNTTSGIITVHPSTTSVLIDGSNADIKLQPGEYIVIHSRAANSYSIIGDGRWKTQYSINKDNSTDSANDLYLPLGGTKQVYYTTSNGSTTLTNIPAAVNTTLESYTIRHLSTSDWVVNQILHNNNGLYFRRGTNNTWGAWKIFAFTDSNITGNAATASAVAWSGVTSKPTTISGYGITDAKIANGTITLGANTITPLTVDGTQTISGAKTFSDNITLDECALRLKASGTVNNSSVSNTDSIIQGLVGNPDSVGLHALIGARGSTIVKAGENGDVYFAGYEGSVEESVVLIADGLIRFITNADTYENRKVITLNTYGSLSGLNDVEAVTFTGDLSGNATSASKLASNFTISLSGDASGSVSTDGTGTATISVAVADDSHNHVISNVDGLQSALNAKAADSGVVHTSGDETVGGVKKFSATVKTTSTFDVVNNNVDMRNVPSDTYNKYIYFDDTNGYAIGVLQSRAAAGSNSIRLKIRKYGDTSTSTAGLVDVGLHYVVSSNEYSFTPSSNGAMRLGGSSSKWSEVFASTGSINTSDVRLKTDIAYIPDEVLAVWETIPFYQFKFKSAVADKGEAARIHSGLLAQDIRDRFAEAGLDVSRYGLFCHDSWDAQEAEYDADGNLEYEAKPAGDEYALRYEEALCMEAACQRRRIGKLEKKIAELEARISAMESKNEA